MKSIKVRFNLGRGKNYMKWKVQYTDGTVEYHSPTDVQLVMRDCILKNYKTVSQKIFDGENKTVCAWVLCKRLEIVKSDRFIKADLDGERIRYNPRVAPHWILDGENVDGEFMHELVSVDFGLYKI